MGYQHNNTLTLRETNLWSACRFDDLRLVILSLLSSSLHSLRQCGISELSIETTVVRELTCKCFQAKTDTNKICLSMLEQSFTFFTLIPFHLAKIQPRPFSYLEIWEGQEDRIP